MRSRIITLTLPLVLAACQSAESPTTEEAAETGAAPTTAAQPAPAEAPAGDHEADGEHAHGSPHGGTVKTAGGGHLELVVEEGALMVYPLDASEAALPVAGIAGAQAIVQPQGGQAQTVALTPMEDHLHGALPEGVTVYTAVVTVPVAGETRSARFEVGLDGDLDHAH